MSPTPPTPPRPPSFSQGESLTPRSKLWGFIFQAQSNRHYFVWYTDALTTPGWQWQLATPASEPIEGTGSPYQFTEPAPPARRFYQVEVKTPE